MTKCFLLLVVILAVIFIHNTTAQWTTSQYGTVGYGSTRLVGFVPTQATQSPVEATTVYNYYARTQAPLDYNRRQQYQTPDPYTYRPYTFNYGLVTSAPERFDNRGRYGSVSASSSQSQSGRGVQVGGSASSGSSYDSRYGGSQYGQAAGYGSSGRGRPDPYAQQTPQQASSYDSRYQGRQEPRYPVYQTAAPVDYSQYPPTVKSLVLSETGIYLFWTDPLVQNGGVRRGQQPAAEKNTKYTVKYNKVSRSRTGEQDAAEQTEETASRDLHLKTLEPGADYSFSVKINRNGQETGWSAPIVNRTLEQLPLAPPSNIKVVPTDRDARITVTAPENFKGSINRYIFLYAPSGGNGGAEERKWQEIEIPGGYAGATEASQLLSGLQAGEEYFYTVQAVNSRGSGPFSEIQSFKTTSGPVYPVPPPYNPYDSPTQAPYPDPYGRDAYGTRSPYSGVHGGGGAYYELTTPDYYGQGYDTTPDYYAQETTAYPGYEQNTPDYYGRYPSVNQQAETPDYYGRYATTEDYYARFRTTPDYNAGDEQTTGLVGLVMQPLQEGAADPHWSPYWAAATQPSAGGRVEPPTDVRVERLEEPSEALVSFTPSTSSGLSEYEILYTYDPTAADDLWQIETSPSEENQAILVRLTTNARVYIKVRAKSPSGDSAFSEVIPFDTLASGDTSRPEAEQDPDAAGANQAQEHGEEEPADEEDPDTAHTRTNRT